MNRPPRHVTFTGVDAHTSFLALQMLAAEYPIEWGVLFSPGRQGVGRYPPLAVVRELVERPGLNLAAHLCGEYAQAFIETGTCSELDALLPAFRRIQINTATKVIDTARLAQIAAQRHCDIILQCRDAFPMDQNVTWLFDASGGRGIRPSAWPAPPTASTWVGYAGGLGPDTIAPALAAISQVACEFYLDMESGVRDAQDRFSIDRCRDVLRQVFGSGDILPAPKDGDSHL